MADSYEKRARERRKQRKQQEKAERKRLRQAQEPADTSDEVTAEDLLGEASPPAEDEAPAPEEKAD